jgi:hypothetical protein
MSAITLTVAELVSRTCSNCILASQPTANLPSQKYTLEDGSISHTCHERSIRCEWNCNLSRTPTTTWLQKCMCTHTVKKYFDAVAKPFPSGPAHGCSLASAGARAAKCTTDSGLQTDLRPPAGGLSYGHHQHAAVFAEFDVQVRLQTKPTGRSLRSVERVHRLQAHPAPQPLAYPLQQHR